MLEHCQIRYPRRSGFTLIELSIVLVIIALIIGGVLVGRDLIKAAEIRAEISQMDKYIAAVNTFRTKYNCLPGDCPNATNFFSGATNGDGNGKIESVWASDGEVMQVWYQLASAGLIAGNYTGTTLPGPGAGWPAPGQSVPHGIINSNTDYRIVWWPTSWWGSTHFGAGESWVPSVSNRVSGHTLMLHQFNDTGTGYFFTGGLNPADAYAIDTKIDDGRPGLGRLVISNCGIDWGKSDANTSQCYVDTTVAGWAGHWQDPAIIYYNLNAAAQLNSAWVQMINPF